MKRLHISLGVTEFEQSIDFYATLFGSRPSVVKDGYAKWLIDDPSINFVIEKRKKRGLDHLGLQVEGLSELDQLADRLKGADLKTKDQREATCCYAKSDKTWTKSPDGVLWETFVTHEDSEDFGEDRAPVID